MNTRHWGTGTVLWYRALCSPVHILSILAFRNSQDDCLWATQYAEVSKSTLSSWPSRSKSGSLSGLLLWVLLCGEGRHAWQILTYLVWPHVSGGVAMYCLGLSSNTERTGWTEIWWKGWIANRWKLFTALYFSFGLLWHGLMTLIFTPLADKLCAIQNIAAKNPLYWHWLEGCFPLKANNC